MPAATVSRPVTTKLAIWGPAEVTISQDACRVAAEIAAVPQEALRDYDRDEDRRGDDATSEQTGGLGAGGGVGGSDGHGSSLVDRLTPTLRTRPGRIDPA